MKTNTTQDLEVQTPAPDPLPSISPILSPRHNAFSVSQSPLFDPKNSTSGTSIGMRSEVLFDRSLEKSIDYLAQQIDQSRAWQDAKFSHVLAETRLLEAKLENMHRDHRDQTVSVPRGSVSPDEYLRIERMLEQQLGVIGEEMEAIKEEVANITQQTQSLSTSIS